MQFKYAMFSDSTFPYCASWARPLRLYLRLDATNLGLIVLSFLSQLSFDQIFFGQLSLSLGQLDGHLLRK